MSLWLALKNDFCLEYLNGQRCPSLRQGGRVMGEPRHPGGPLTAFQREGLAKRSHQPAPIKKNQLSHRFWIRQVPWAVPRITITLKPPELTPTILTSSQAERKEGHFWVPLYLLGQWRRGRAWRQLFNTAWGKGGSSKLNQRNLVSMVTF